MRLFLVLSILSLLWVGTKAQDIASLKTDADCLRFIRNLKGFEDFYFDTLFTKEELKKLEIKEPCSNWGKVDFDYDGKPDLYFVGTFQQNFFPHYYAYLLLSKNNPDWKLVSLFRKTDGQYDPLLFHRKTGTKNLLFVYLFAKTGWAKTNSMVLVKQQFYPKEIRVVDTFVYKYENLINFVSKPSALQFDSLDCSFYYQQSPQGNKFKIYKDGSGVLSTMVGNTVAYEKKITLLEEELKLLKNLVREIDLVNTDTAYSLSWTDDSTARLRIYEGSKVIYIYDYGMETTFTIKAIYACLFKIMERQSNNFFQE